MKFTLTLIFAAALLISCTEELPVTITPTTMATANSSTVAASTVDIATFPHTASATSTEIPTETLSPILLTQEAMVSSCAAKEKAWYTKHLSTTYFTHENWGAVGCSDHGIYTRVSNESLDITWTLPPFDDDVTTPDPIAYWIPYLWSADGQYLYLEPIFLGYIDSPWLIYTSGFGLSRLNLGTGEFSIWIQPSIFGHSFEFTQDETLFAFSPPDFNNTIRIRDLISGKEQNISLKEKYSILHFRWTPDGSRLVILTEEFAGDASRSGFSVLVYNVTNEVLRKLLDNNNLNPSGLNENFNGPRISISDLSNEALFLSDIFQENAFELNIKTGELTQVNSSLTPTPTSQ
jgi:hypothetical protein